jgi:mono/diheme cytochrome c family protein
MLTLLFALACGAAEPPTPAAPVEAAAAPAEVAAVSPPSLGAQVYLARCATCHGPQGKGDGPAASALTPPPTDLTGPRPADKRGQPGGRRVIIEQGSPGTAMVGFKGVLTDEELLAVEQFVHELRHGPGAPMPPAGGQGMGGGRGPGGGMGGGGGS